MHSTNSEFSDTTLSQEKQVLRVPLPSRQGNSLVERLRTPAAFHVMAKPTGAICNLNCEYCYYLEKEKLYPGQKLHMSDDLLENYIQQYLQSQRTRECTLSWHGGEPMLMGMDFFKKAIALEKKYQRPGTTIRNSIQTNGVLLNDEWCKLFKDYDFLVGISVDGPQHLHDTYRVDKKGQPTFTQVMKGVRLLQHYEVEFNILTTVNAVNAPFPLEVYRFLRDEIPARFIQFIPVVEKNLSDEASKSPVRDVSVKAEQYGQFLITIFDEWVKRNVGEIFVQIFDVALAAWVGAPPSLCIFAPTCGNALAMEYNGDLYSCDHFVEPEHRLGNISNKPMSELVASMQQRQFGWDKQATLPQYCRDCSVKFVCNGGCPKNRLIQTPSGEPGLNYLCAGYKAFFEHIDRPMRTMASLLTKGRAPAEIMKHRMPE